MSNIRFKSIFTKSIIVLLLFMVGTSIFLPPQVYAKTVNLESHLSQEEIQRAKASAERMIAEAEKKAHESGAYDYDVGRIVRTAIFSILMMAVFSALYRWFNKFRIARILLIQILFILICFVLSVLMIFFNIFVIR